MSAVLVVVTMGAAGWWGATRARAVPELGGPPAADDVNLFAGVFAAIALGGPLVLPVLALYGWAVGT